MYNSRSNLILGFHGCDRKVRDKLLTSPNIFLKSEKPYDWLGHGIYFWENNYERALLWAKEKASRNEIEEASVIGAALTLDYCLDFTDSRFIMMIKGYYDLLEYNYKTFNKKLPQNKDIKSDNFKDKILRELDCSVIEFMNDQILEQMKTDIKEFGFTKYKLFDSVRGIFTEGGPAFPGAGIQSKNHIQICIRNSNCIKGFFLPRNEIVFPEF